MINLKILEPRKYTKIKLSCEKNKNKQKVLVRQDKNNKRYIKIN